MLEPNNRRQIQEINPSNELSPLLNHSLANVIPGTAIDVPDHPNFSRGNNSKHARAMAKLAVYAFKRLLQDLSISYAGYSIVTKLNPDARSAYAYYPVIGFAILATAEDVLYEANKVFFNSPAFSERKHEVARIVKHSIDTGFAAGTYLSGFPLPEETNNQTYIIAATSTGLALIASKMSLDLLYQTQRQFTRNRRFKMTKIIFDTLGSYLIAAGVADYCTGFLQHVAFSGKKFATSEVTNEIIQAATGVAAAAITVMAKYRHSHKTEEVLESVMHAVIYMMMGIVFSFDAYTSAEPKTKIPDAYGYPMMIFFMVTMFLFYGRDIYEIVKRPAPAVLHVRDFALLDPVVEDGLAVNVEPAANDEPALDHEPVADDEPVADHELTADDEQAEDHEQLADELEEAQQKIATQASASSTIIAAPVAASSSATAVPPVAASSSTITTTPLTVSSTTTTTVTTVVPHTNISKPQTTTNPSLTTRPTYISQSPRAGTLFSSSQSQNNLINPGPAATTIPLRALSGP